MHNKNLLLLVDGSSYLYRAFHGLPPLNTQAGQPTGAIYGVLNMLNRLILDHPPQYIAVVFDAPGKTFRHEMYAAYKANRPPMPGDLRSQIQPLHAIIEALGIPLVIEQGVEADDVIGTLARNASMQGLRTLISTGDKDLAQLVNEDITLINTMNNTLLTPASVKNKFGVQPEQIIDYLALIGDTSDNIPGIPKVGPKTAAKWLATYENIDTLVAHADEITGKIGNTLREHLGQLPLSKDLATIRINLAIPHKFQELVQKPQKIEELMSWYQQLEFKTWLKNLDNNTSIKNKAPRPAPPNKNYETIFTQDQLNKWLKQLKTATLFSFDLETTSLHYHQANIVGASFATSCGTAAYVPLAHDYPDAPPQLNRDEVLAQLKPLLEDPRKNIVGQNLKYDMNVLKNYDIILRGARFDSMLESYVLNSIATRHNMDALAKKYLDIDTIHYEDVAGKGAKQISFNHVRIEEAAPYAAEDADITLQLHEKLWPQLLDTPKLQQLFENIEMPLVRILSNMEYHGVLIDTQMLAQQNKELATAIKNIEQEAHEQVGEPFNLGSPKQIQAIFYEKLKLPILKKTPKGQPSTAENVLQELALDYPLPKLILEYRSLSKLRSTYTEKLPKMINPKTQRIHTSYHQAVATTGRLSSSDPNLQNIPIRSKEGRRIRQAFIAPDHYCIVAADYSQIELRIMAHLSQDPGLLDAFRNGQDIHKATAAEIFNIALGSVNSEQRRSAKAINFGLIYGMSAFGLSQQLGINRKAAQDYMDRYFERYPAVKNFMEKTKEIASEQGYVETLFGRRLYLPDIKARQAQRRQYAERAAINAPMQGTAADIIKLAMIKTQQWLEDKSPNVNMVMQVHDELVFEVHESEIELAREQIKTCMSNATKLSVPLIVDIGTGKNWDEAH
ncbi:MAG: DNA polymerase I [Gammaproteobacteria bacterium]|nr:DNA polymerase I [Gammaproteobacteria bacterium]